MQATVLARMSTSSAAKGERALVSALRRDVRRQANPGRAEQQQAYMKSAMPYAGLTAGQLRAVCKDVFAAHPLNDAQAWRAAAARLWREAKVREERYAAIELLASRRYSSSWRDPELTPLLEEMIVSGAWWDFVDTLAINQMGPLLESHRRTIRPKLMRWATRDDLWLRRTAILAQIKFKARTDTDLLHHAIQGSIFDGDFFARKAIGWALREFAKTNPQWVVDYVRDHAHRLSSLSQREALRILRKQGVVAP